MNRKLFLQACEKVMDNTPEYNSIGTLSEKTVHAVLKNYLAADETCHEVKIDNYYADIFCDKGILEIQTRNFDKLRKKLDVFLKNYSVTIVYPIAYKKWLRWINEESGEISPPRKSPKTGTPYMIFPELYKIKSYLLHPNLHLQLVLIDIEEYRYLNGWSKDKKKGSERCDGIPTDLVQEIYIDIPLDYLQLIPDTLGDTFTSRDYKIASKLSQNHASTALNILYHVGAVKRIGKDKRAYLYSR
ncbi:hypothetical protein [Anaerocolumna cellulosilytica]|nr:hypothetical protein [Anaerocolumna cellulosilytica]MBB5196227.1 hypothetical protein [Anaerocolumna cellulosilytica]